MFAGIGGFDLAAQRSGGRLAWHAEIDPFCRRVLAKRFPGVQQISDVREIDASHGAIDLLAGGFPCQDLSVAGKRAGLAGERSGLFWEIVRVARECGPRWLLLENVPGLLSSGEGSDFALILGALGELGYGFASRVLDAQYFGVAQRRRRVFIVGCLGDARCAAEVLFEPESCPRHPAPRRQTGTRAAYSLGASVRGTGDGHGNAWNTDYVFNPYRSLERDGTVSEGFKPDTVTDALHGPTGNKEPLVAATLNSGGNSGGFRTEPGEHLTFDGAFGVRRLMPVECERLQGFPDGWTCLENHPQQCDCPDSLRYRALGNAVAVPVVEWVLRRIVGLS